VHVNAEPRLRPVIHLAVFDDLSAAITGESTQERKQHLGAETSAGLRGTQKKFEMVRKYFTAVANYERWNIWEMSAIFVQSSIMERTQAFLSFII